MLLQVAMHRLPFAVFDNSSKQNSLPILTILSKDLVLKRLVYYWKRLLVDTLWIMLSCIIIYIHVYQHVCIKHCSRLPMVTTAYSLSSWLYTNNPLWSEVQVHPKNKTPVSPFHHYSYITVFITIYYDANEIRPLFTPFHFSWGLKGSQQMV